MLARLNIPVVGQKQRFQTDFSDYAIGDITNHPDWSNTIGTTGLTDSVESDGASISGKQLRLSQSSAVTNAVRYVPPGSPTDVDILSLVESISVTGEVDWGYVYARGLPGSNVPAIGFDRLSGVEKLGMLKGTGAWDFTNFTWSGSSSWYIRLRISGTNVKAKAWALGSAEPGAWNYDYTDSGMQSSGHVGYLALRTGGSGVASTFAARFFSVATGGGVAPFPSG